MNLGTRTQLLNDAIKKAESGNRSMVPGFANNLSRPVGQPMQETGPGMALEVLRRYMELFEKEDLRPLKDDLKRLTEKLELLDGSRSRTAAGKRAVRFEELQSITGLSRYRITAKELTDPPTADDFNALRQDMRTILAALSEISVALSRSTTR